MLAYGPIPHGSAPPRTLVLGQNARGDTTRPDGRASGLCRGGGLPSQGDLYGFEVKTAATYSFELWADFNAALSVQDQEPERARGYANACAWRTPGKSEFVSIPLEPGLYWIAVDGNNWDEAGTYTLRVDVDTSFSAAIGPENPGKVWEMVANAGPLSVGKRWFGTWRNMPGGARTSCGLMGGDGLRRLSLDHAARLRVRAAAQFPFAIEVRPIARNGEAHCVRSPEGKYEAELTADLAAGEYVAVIDAAHLAPRNRDDSRDSRSVVGSYIVDLDELPR